jgi:hypothetical protein
MDSETIGSIQMRDKYASNVITDPQINVIGPQN